MRSPPTRAAMPDPCVRRKSADKIANAFFIVILLSDEPVFPSHISRRGRGRRPLSAPSYDATNVPSVPSWEDRIPQPGQNPAPDQRPKTEPSVSSLKDRIPHPGRNPDPNQRPATGPTVPA